MFDKLSDVLRHTMPGAMGRGADAPGYERIDDPHDSVRRRQQGDIDRRSRVSVPSDTLSR
jgi:hypothetical protein